MNRNMIILLFVLLIIVLVVFILTARFGALIPWFS
jgi:hypothetical protein